MQSRSKFIGVERIFWLEGTRIVRVEHVSWLHAPMQEVFIAVVPVVGTAILQSKFLYHSQLPQWIWLCVVTKQGKHTFDGVVLKKHRVEGSIVRITKATFYKAHLAKHTLSTCGEHENLLLNRRPRDNDEMQMNKRCNCVHHDRWPGKQPFQIPFICQGCFRP